MRLTVMAVNTSEARLYRWDEVPKTQLTPLLTRRFITGNNGMMVIFDIKKGSFIAKHKHMNEQFTYVMKGMLRFHLESNKDVMVKTGEVLHIPPNIEHSVEALEDSLDLDVFIPTREDWLRGEETYLKDRG